jgi:hypothetical protein
VSSALDAARHVGLLCSRTLGVAPKVHSGEERQCLPPEVAIELLPAAIDLVLAAHSAFQSQAAVPADLLESHRLLSDTAACISGTLRGVMVERPELKGRLVGALLGRQRLLLWLRCLGKMCWAAPAVDALFLLLCGITGVLRRGDGAVCVAGGLDLSEAKAAEVGPRLYQPCTGVHACQAATPPFCTLCQ